MYIIIAILAGVTIVLNRVVNFNLAEKIGVFQGTFFHYLLGIISSFLFLIITNEKLLIGYENLANIPIWAYFGGALGVIIVALFTYITPRVSGFYITIFSFIGQLFVGVIIDYFTSGHFSLGKTLGGAMVVVGLIYNLRLDNVKNNEVIEEGIV